MTHEVLVETLADERFSRVVDAFAVTLDETDRSGAALSIWMDGQPLVEARGGMADGQARRAWQHDTLSVIFSCTKGLAAIAVGQLLQSGLLPSLETPLADIWPAFGTHGKERVSVGDALAHRAGVSAPRDDISLAQLINPDEFARIIAEQIPLWQPGSSHQYHAVTVGAISAQIVARLTGRSLGQYFEEEIARPLGASAWIGLPPEKEANVAHIIRAQPAAPTPPPTKDANWLARAITLGGALPLDLLGPGRGFNDPELHAAEIGGAGGIANASSLAQIWSATVATTNGVRLIDDETVRALVRPRSSGEPFYDNGPPPYQAWGAGVMIPSAWDPYLSASSFGHDGAGGQVAFADHDARIGFAYLTNRAGDMARGMSIVDALRASLG